MTFIKGSKDSKSKRCFCLWSYFFSHSFIFSKISFSISIHSCSTPWDFSMFLNFSISYWKFVNTFFYIKRSHSFKYYCSFSAYAINFDFSPSLFSLLILKFKNVSLFLISSIAFYLFYLWLNVLSFSITLKSSSTCI